MEDLLNIFDSVRTCGYRDETYHVRDNGAVFRCRKPGKRKRPKDEEWTFGTVDTKTGYFYFSSERVHRIVATAFHGSQPLDKPIVDHIDTNRKNNRPENLRWVSRLENILLNPMTVKRIESICNCDIDEFLQNPEKYRTSLSNESSDIQWMRTVSRSEAKQCLDNLTSWSKTDKPLKVKKLGEWIYHRNQSYSEDRIEEIFKHVENKTGISRKILCNHKALRGKYYDARQYLAKLFYTELNLPVNQIGKLIGISTTTVKQYLDIAT